VDANLSVRRPGDPLGTKTEVKNMNSFANVERALEAERTRQIAMLERGERVTQVTLTGGQCPRCGEPFKAKAPQGLEPGSPFGPNMRAQALYLRYVHGVSFERLAHLFSHLFGLEISEGALVNMIKASRDAFARQTEAIRQTLFAHGAMASDETTARVGKKNWWLWVFHHDDSAVFRLKPSRGKDVVEEFLDGYRPGYWVSDRYGSQIGWAAKDQQFCLSHLIRDAQYAIDAGDAIFAPGLKGLLKYACVLGRRRDRLMDSTLKAYERKLEARLDKLMALKPEAAEGRKLQTAIKGCRCHLFVFMTNRQLSPTNNGSEQALRPAVIFRNYVESLIMRSKRLASESNSFVSIT